VKQEIERERQSQCQKQECRQSLLRANQDILRFKNQLEEERNARSKVQQQLMEAKELNADLRCVLCFKEECVKQAWNLKKAEERLTLYV